MAKRRVYTPGRDEGWSNGKYWKRKEAHGPQQDDYYTAYCPDCDADTLHEYDYCTVCELKEHASDKK